MTCFAVDDPFRCPTKWELWRQIIDLGPRGRAWQTHEQVNEIVDLTMPGEPFFDTPDNSQPFGTVLTMQQQYWAAYAEVLAYLHERACALLEEFFCATAREQLAEKRIDWGFPDTCEPYASLCQKVADNAGQSCSDLVAMAAARGWSIECKECVIDVNAADIAAADCATPACQCSAITITVHTAASPAYVAPSAYPVGDLAIADCTTLCPPGLEGISCLIENIRPAHIPVIYEVV